MSAPQSLPTPLPQPDVAEYSIDALNLFLTYDTPAAYEAYFGVAPPPYNPSLPIKQWKDDSQANQPPGWQSEYMILQVVVDPVTGVSQLVLPPTYVQMFLPSTQAANVNIYGGAPVYPVWTSAPTVAVITGTSGVISGVDPNLLSDLADATALNTQLGGTGVQTYVMAPGPDNFQINYGTETRRQYYFIDSDGQLQWVGFLLRQQYVNGVGAPGSWVNSVVAIPGNMSMKVWMWIPAPAPAGPPANATICPMPIRQLYSASNPPPAGGAFESFTQPMVGQPMIVRASV
jgi:hypothetical protein